MTYAWHGIDADTGTNYDEERLERVRDEMYEDPDACARVAKKLAEREPDLIANLAGAPFASATVIAEQVASLQAEAAPLWWQEAMNEIENREEV